VSPEETSLVPRDDDDAAADFADLGALFASVVPVVGSAVSFVLATGPPSEGISVFVTCLKG
jgi:hypothetical protein